MAAMLFAGCTSEQQIRKSALRYFKDGNSAYLHRDYQNAIWNYRKAITMDSETPEFHFNLGLVYFELGNYPEALDAYMRVAELRPGLSDTYYNIALAYHRMEQSTDADRYYNRYQDMLSLRKAKELARKKAEMKQQEQPAVAADTKPVKANKPKDAYFLPNFVPLDRPRLLIHYIVSLAKPNRRFFQMFWQNHYQ